MIIIEAVLAKGVISENEPKEIEFQLFNWSVPGAAWFLVMGVY